MWKKNWICSLWPQQEEPGTMDGNISGCNVDLVSELDKYVGMLEEGFLFCVC